MEVDLDLILIVSILAAVVPDPIGCGKPFGECRDPRRSLEGHIGSWHLLSCCILGDQCVQGFGHL